MRPCIHAIHIHIYTQRYIYIFTISLTTRHNINHGVCRHHVRNGMHDCYNRSVTPTIQCGIYQEQSKLLSDARFA